MKIYIVKDDMRLGPFTLEEVKRQGISADTLVWFKGMPDWKEARAIPELAKPMSMAELPTSPTFHLPPR